MKKVKLTQNKFAIVDDEDFDFINQWKWFLNDNGYAVRSVWKGKKIRMHRLINQTLEGMDTDHINRNRLDNRKSNLRTLTRSQNNLNTGLWNHNTSGVKGVTWDKSRNKWAAQIQVKGKNVHLGRYEKFNSAKLAREQGEIIYYGQSI